MSVVEKHPVDTDFSVATLAMSQSPFYRRLKSIAGQAAVELIRDVRLKRAAQLLFQTSMRVSEAAFEVGITDPAYFRKVFQKLFGQSPSEYAMQHRAAIRSAAATGEQASGA